MALAPVISAAAMMLATPSHTRFGRLAKTSGRAPRPVASAVAAAAAVTASASARDYGDDHVSLTSSSRGNGLVRALVFGVALDGLTANDQHRAARVMKDAGGHAPEERALHRTPAMRADDEEERGELLGRLADRLDRKTAKNRGPGLDAGLLRVCRRPRPSALPASASPSLASSSFIGTGANPIAL